MIDKVREYFISIIYMVKIRFSGKFLALQYKPKILVYDVTYNNGSAVCSVTFMLVTFIRSLTVTLELIEIRLQLKR